MGAALGAAVGALASLVAYGSVSAAPALSCGFTGALVTHSFLSGPR